MSEQVERAAQAIYETGGAFWGPAGVIAWADLDGTQDAENFRAMARAALANLWPANGAVCRDRLDGNLIELQNQARDACDDYWMSRFPVPLAPARDRG